VEGDICTIRQRRARHYQSMEESKYSDLQFVVLWSFWRIMTAKREEIRQTYLRMSVEVAAG